MAGKFKLSALGMWVGIGVTAATVVQELRKPAEQRTWHGDLYGIPYDYRAPSADKVRATYWSPDDSRILMPKVFGWGWDVNVGRVVRLASETLSTAVESGEHR